MSLWRFLFTQPKPKEPPFLRTESISFYISLPIKLQSHTENALYLLLLLLLLLYHHYHSHSLSLPRVYRHSILSSLPPKCCCCLRNFHNRSSGAHTFTDVQCTSISLLDLLLFSPVTLAFPRISFPFTFFIPLNWFNVLKQPVFFWHNFFPSNSPKFDRTTQKHSVAGSFSLKCTIVIAN